MESYINGHRFIPHCVYTGELATVCRCEDGQSFNCTTDDNQEKIQIYRTTGTDSCLSDGFARRRRKRDAPEQDAEDDDVIFPDDIPVPPSPNITDFPPAPTWPTPSGITEQQARVECLRVMENYAAFNKCRQFVDLEPITEPCVLNIQVCYVDTAHCDMNYACCFQWSICHLCLPLVSIQLCVVLPSSSFSSCT